MNRSSTTPAWKHFIGGLISPSPSVQPDEERQRVSLAAALSGALLLVALIFAPLWVMTSPNFATVPWISGGIILACAIAYVFSRTRYYSFGIFIIIYLLPCVVTAVILTVPGPVSDRLLSLDFLVIGILLASLLVSIRGTLVVALVSVVMTAASLFISDVAISLAYSRIVYAAVLSALLIVVAGIRHRYVRRLRESEHRYRSLFEQSTDAVFILGLNGRHLAANHRAAEMLGYAREELLNLSFRDIVAYSELVKTEQVFQQLLSGRRYPLYERRFRKKDGTEFPVEVNVELVRAPDGKPLHMQCLVRDITTRKQVEQALRESETRQRALLLAIPDLMFRNRRDGTYMDVQAADPGVMASPEGQLIGQAIKDLFPAEEIARHQQYVEQVLRTGQETVYELSFESQDHTFVFEARLVASGRDEVLTILRDITALKQLREKSFALAVEQERNKILSQFVHAASHELRTPLSIINSSLYLMNRVTDETRRKKYGDQIEGQITTMTHLLDMILTMTRLDVGTAFQLEQTNINAGLEQIISNLRESWETKKLTVGFEPDHLLPPVYMDMKWLPIALIQLLENAIKFTPEGSSITIRTNQDVDCAIVEIQDSGMGISPEGMPHVFERFWRQDEARTTSGFGLGLPIAQKIIEQHGGKLELESESGSGCTVRVSLPLRLEATAQLPNRVPHFVDGKKEVA